MLNVDSSQYNSSFYDMLDRTSAESAQAIVPIVMELISPESVVDVGCGRGAWLTQFAEEGVARLKGYDSHLVDQTQLLIDRSKFEVRDFSSSFAIDGEYDLAICLEVAEHIPSRMASHLIEQLTRSSSVVLFSAAIPGQGGTHHLNEQWHEYWHAKFAAHGFGCFDIVRSRIINNKKVAWWFRQNIFVYAGRGRETSEVLKRARDAEDNNISPIASHVLRQYTSVRGLRAELAKAIVRALKNRLVEIFPL